MAFDVTTIGNALVDLLLTIPQDDIHTSVVDGKFHIKAGEKIIVDKTTFSVGGGACRVAVGLSRLGFQTGIVATIGDDEFQHAVIDGLKAENVDITRLVNHHGQSAFAVGLTFQKERTLFVHHLDVKHTFHLDDLQTRWIYLAALGGDWKEAYENVVSYGKKTGTKLAFNPGPSQFHEGLGSFRFVLEATDMLIVNKDEAARILSVPLETSVPELLQKLQDIGPRIVVITDGESGAYAISSEKKKFFLSAVPCEIIEKTGAGDAFGTGFLAALISQKSIETAMKWGSANSASVIGKVGGHHGLLSRNELEENVRQLEIEVKEL